MKIVINGNETEYAESMTISQLLVRENVMRPEMVSVELNGRILKRSEFENTSIKDGDKIEFLYFMGGGNGSD